MNMVRLGVLIWLFLPVPIYWLIRRWYFAQIRKYLLTTSGRIVDIVSYHYGVGEYYDQSGMTVRFAYSVAGTEYTGQGSLEGSHQPGEEIRVRYNPERPEKSRLDDLRDKIQGAAGLDIIVLLADLGYFIFTISIGLLFLFVGIRMLIRRPPEWSQWTPLRAILVALLVFILSLPFVVIGILGLVVDGFWNQNILWALWNH